DGAIVNCYSALEALRHPYLVADLARATNDWIVSEWLDNEPRLFASVVVSPHFPESAAEEIRRAGADQRFVQVLLPARPVDPSGPHRSWPIFAAAAETGLVVALHFGGLTGNPPTSSGWPSYYIEEYVGMAHIFQTQVTSMVVGGVFDEFPSLRVSLC